MNQYIYIYIYTLIIKLSVRLSLHSRNNSLSNLRYVSTTCFIYIYSIYIHMPDNHASSQSKAIRKLRWWRSGFNIWHGWYSEYIWL